MPCRLHCQVRISYIDTMADTETRRRELRNGYFFDCDCLRCSAGGGGPATGLERALRCGSAGCPAAVPLPVSADERPRCPRCRYDDYPADVGAQFDELAQLTRTYAQDSTVCEWAPRGTRRRRLRTAPDG